MDTHASIVARSARILLDESGCNECAKLMWDDVKLGKLLGSGAFCKVQEVTIVSNHNSGKKDCSSLEIDKENYYAIKRVKDFFYNIDKDEIEFSFYQLKMEAILLSQLSHENIIALHAVGGGEEGAFLILDRLTSTLESKMERWSKDKGMSLMDFFLGNVPTQQRQQQKYCLESVAVPIARALEHLHSKLIVFRDLKPDNVGFGSDGNVKLFDFGLASQIPKGHSLLTGISGLAGTLRYMSPECFQKKNYGSPADVYSFGILLWELMTLEKPFDDYYSDQLVEQKTNGARPTLSKKSGPLALHPLMKRCWDQDPAQRPTFAEVIPDLVLTTKDEYFVDDSSVSSHSTGDKDVLSRRNDGSSQHSGRAVSPSSSRRVIGSIGVFTAIDVIAVFAAVQSYILFEVALAIVFLPLLAFLIRYFLRQDDEQFLPLAQQDQAASLDARHDERTLSPSNTSAEEAKSTEHPHIV